MIEAGGPSVLDPILPALSIAVARLRTEQRFLAIQQRVRAALQQSPGAPQAWEPLPLDLIESALPAGIRSCWIFRLRAGATFGAERHSNSHQRSVALNGMATFEVLDGDSWSAKTISGDARDSLSDSWISIPPSQWHRIQIGPADFESCSFHTAPADELLEETPVGDDLNVTRKRLYQGDGDHL
jgi:hypothetical protein